MSHVTLQELEYCQSVVLSVTDDHGVRTVMDELLGHINNKENRQRRAAVTILHVFCANTKADLTHFVPQLIRGLIHLFMETDEDVLHVAWDCLNAVTKVNIIIIWYISSYYCCVQRILLLW